MMMEIVGRKRLEGDDEAEEGNNGSGADGVGLVGRALEGSGRVDGTGSGRSRGGGGSAVAVRSLDLAVGDLGNGALGRSSLDLTVGNLGDGSGGAGGSSAGLDLAVGDLRDGCAGGSSSAGLDLTVGDLRNGSTRCAGLDLTVRDLGDRGRGLLGLAVGKLRSSGGGRGASAGTDDLDGDLVALRAGALVVQVVEVAAQALVESGLTTKGKRAVGASGPTGSVDGTSLGRAVELELVVGGDVTSALLGVKEYTVLEGDLKLHGVVLLALVDGAGSVGGGHVGDLDLELAIVAGRAAFGGRGVRLDLLSHTLGDGRGDSDSREGNGGGSVTHFD